MDTNAVADAIRTELGVIHARTYRNKSPQSPVNPFIVFALDTATAPTPSVDYSLEINVYDDPHASSESIETIADSIQSAFDCHLIRTSSLNLHLVMDQRQYIPNTDLITAQMINLRFVVRAYFI